MYIYYILYIQVRHSTGQVAPNTSIFQPARGTSGVQPSKESNGCTLSNHSSGLITRTDGFISVGHIK